MLPASNRLRRSDDFERAVRHGRRVGRRTVVLHLLLGGGGDAAPRIGFVVSKAVGGAVQRHQVQRRLRAAVWDQLPLLPGGSLTVVRALPASASASYAELHADVAACVRRMQAPR